MPYASAAGRFKLNAFDVGMMVQGVAYLFPLYSTLLFTAPSHEREYLHMTGIFRAHALHLERDCTKGWTGCQATLPAKRKQVQPVLQLI